MGIAQSVPWLAGVDLREPFREAVAPAASDGLAVADLTRELGLTPAQLRLIRDQLAAEGSEVSERFHCAGTVNRLLERIGLQRSTRDRKGRLRWILTEEGKHHADALIGTAASGPPREVPLIRWSRSVLEPLAQAAAELLAEAQAAAGEG